MTLQTLLSTLTTKTLQTTISDSSKKIITFVSEGYEGVESDILAREVVSWGTKGNNLDIIITAVPKPAGTLTLSAYTAELESVGDTEQITVTAATGDVTAVSSDLTIASVSVDKTGTDPIITVEAVAEGSATITVTSGETEEYQAATKEIEVTVTIV